MQYQVSFTSLYTMTMLIVRSSIVHLTPIWDAVITCTPVTIFFPLAWGAVMLDKKNKN